MNRLVLSSLRRGVFRPSTYVSQRLLSFPSLSSPLPFPSFSLISSPLKMINPMNGVTIALNDLISGAIWFLKRTFQPSLIRRKRKHGFLSRIATNNGRKMLNRRRLKKRRYVSA